MKRHLVVFVSIAILFACACAVSAAQDDISQFKACKTCGMDIAKYKNTRVLIEYADGRRAGFCSITCAAGEYAGGTAKNILVADYNTAELIDARTAAWVISDKPGVMTSRAKPAFADKDAAQAYIAKNGGEPAGFDQIIEAAAREGGGKHAHMGHHDHTGHGSQMMYNPAFGDQIYHTHPAGMWMINYKFMRMEMNGLRAGGTDVGLGSVGFNRGKQYNYMMIPTGMTMDMHMFMAMYGITDRLTVMAMGGYQYNNMGMLMDMGMGARPDPPMKTSGWGDTELDLSYKFNDFLTGTMGLSIPTGSIEETFTTMRRVYRAPYDMQLGSGTVDLKPSITYNQLSSDSLWNWGAQATFTWHPAENENGWARGDNFKLTGWLQRAFGPASSWVRMVFNDTGKIRGEDAQIQRMMNYNPRVGAPMPDGDPANYGGQRIDFLTGVSLTLGGFSFGVEGGIPIYENLNGLQMRTDWVITTGVQMMF